MHEKDLENAILTKSRSLDRVGLERLVQEKLKAAPFLTRLGALLIILEEQGLAGNVFEHQKSDEYGFTRISFLTSGLQNVSVVGRVLGYKKIVVKDGKPALRLRLWDGTGALNVMVWQNFVDLAVGDIVAVWNGYIPSIKPGRAFTLQAGSRSKVEKLPQYDNLPPLDLSAFKLPRNTTVTASNIDFSAVVVLSMGVKQLRDGVDVCELIVTDGEMEILLTAWREWARFFSEVQPGQRFIAASASVRNGEVSTDLTTCITLLGFDRGTLEKAHQRCLDFCLKVLGVGLDGLPTVTDGVKMMKLVFPVVHQVDRYVIVEKALVICRRGILHIYGTTLKKTECEVKTPQFDGEIEAREGRLVDGIITCSIVRKTPLTFIDTKYGRRKIIGFWASYGGKTYSCSAWDRAAEQLENLSEGTNMEIAFPLIRINRSGQTEISIDSKSYIKPL